MPKPIRKEKITTLVNFKCHSLIPVDKKSNFNFKFLKTEIIKYCMPYISIFPKVPEKSFC